MNIYKQLRRERGLTQSEVAVLIGVERSRLSKVESGRVLPSEDFCKRWGAYFGRVPETEAIAKPSAQNASEMLREHRRSIRRAFPPAQISEPPSLLQCFEEACFRWGGDGKFENYLKQIRSGSQEVAIRRLAVMLDSSEQAFLLWLLLKGGTVQRTSPSEVQLDLPYVVHPGRPWLAVHLGPCVYFPQVTLALPYKEKLDSEARKILAPRLDFLLAVATRPPLFIDVEVDGGSHRGREARDAARARAIGLYRLKIEVEKVHREGFWEPYESELKSVVSLQGLQWPRVDWKSKD